MSKKRRSQAPVKKEKKRPVRQKPIGVGVEEKRIENPYVPNLCTVESVVKETQDTKTLKVKFNSQHKPGQFVQVSLLGVGECPISIASSSNDYLELCIRDVGQLTHQLQQVKEREKIGIRGPYGSSYPMEEFNGKRIVIIGGGSGVAPLRGVIKYIEQHAIHYPEVHLIFGFRNPDEILFKKDMDRWAKLFNLKITVDKGNSGWNGDVGLITKLIEKINPSPANCVAILCGPPIMIKFTLKSLKALGFSDEQIWLSLERQMKCGIGKCGHCMIGSKLVCKDGPVFNYTEAKKLSD